MCTSFVGNKKLLNMIEDAALHKGTKQKGNRTKGTQLYIQHKLKTIILLWGKNYKAKIEDAAFCKVVLWQKTYYCSQGTGGWGRGGCRARF
jgi:hypothetical protein